MTLRLDSIGTAVKVMLLTVVVSFFFFPIGIKGLPPSLNTKQILGLLGIALFAFRSFRARTFSFPKEIITAFILASVFSLWCYFSSVYNNSSDYAYARYYLSFAVWLGGAYATVELIRIGHGRADLELLTRYLAFMCILQCISAFLVDSNEAFKAFVDTYVIQDTVPRNLHRLYGIGCSLDSAGVRFCCVEILIAHQISTNRMLLENKSGLVFYVVSLLAIGVLGNMIARTTTIGLVLAIGYILVSYGYIRSGSLTRRQVRFMRTAFWLVAITVVVLVILYNSDYSAARRISFAFESFFSFFGTGELRSSSTDRLMTMWRWPEDEMGWILGYAQFSAWGDLGSDIGYCRFI